MRISKKFSIDDIAHNKKLQREITKTLVYSLYNLLHPAASSLGTFDENSRKQEALNYYLQPGRKAYQVDYFQSFFYRIVENISHVIFITVINTLKRTEPFDEK